MRFQELDMRLKTDDWESNDSEEVIFMMSKDRRPN